MHKPPLPLDRPFSTAQAAAWGYDRKTLSRLVASRTLRRLFTNVYAARDCDLTLTLRLRAAAMAMHHEAVLCDRTAAWVWGVDTFGYAELDVTPPLESYRLRGHRRTDRQGCAGGSRDLLPEDWVLVCGVRVTTPLRTALDLGCNLPPRDALAAMDALARAHGAAPRDLGLLLSRFFRRRGVVQARRLVRLVDARAESAGESWVREVLDAHGFEMPELQHWVEVDGVPTYRLDLAYVHARIAIEYDGEEFHSSPEDRQADRERREWLRDQGWHIIVLTKASFTPEAINAWTSELRSVLTERTRSHKRF